MNETTVEIRQKQDVYALKTRTGETAEEAVIRELGWALNGHIKKYKSFQKALNHLGWVMSTTL